MIYYELTAVQTFVATFEYIYIYICIIFIVENVNLERENFRF